MTAPTFSVWLTDKIGPNWVVARRAPRILAKYGNDIYCISAKQWRDLHSEYRALYGDPNDDQRAAMYRALRDLLQAPRDANYALVMRRARLALDAEAAL